ncbi:hypothetical protein WJX73_006113 [Symbiochloris irregularis]|uniref:Uncharacterized protein n=1 Tax=Symbiochloris irregularis TaxID=706552 RepID=A0AAW1P055_9CHLO
MEAIVGTALSAVGSAATLGLQQYAASQKRQEEREAEQLALKKELDDPAEGTSTLINRLDYPIEGITSLLSV